MLVQNSKLFGFDSRVIWWPDSVPSVRDHLKQNHIVVLWQCPASIAAEVRACEFRRRPFRTPLVDLSLTDDQLWQRLDAKSCRYEVRKAQKMNVTTLRNEETESARLLINEGIRRLQYRAEISPKQWEELLPTHDVFLCKSEATPIAAHVILLDAPRRARLLLSGTVDREDPRYRNVVGPLNRLLHWTELQYYRKEGFQFYDFGGCDLDKNSSTYPITQFKLSFGAEVVEEPILYLANNPALRITLQATTGLGEALKRMPWLKKSMKAVRNRLSVRSQS